MTIPVEVTFHAMPANPLVETRIRQWADRMAHIHDRLLGCQVGIGVPHRRQRRGRRYDVRVRLILPGEELIVSRDPGRTDTHDDIHVALRDALQAARRQLDHHVGRQRASRSDRGRAAPVPPARSSASLRKAAGSARASPSLPR